MKADSSIKSLLLLAAAVCGFVCRASANLEAPPDEFIGIKRGSTKAEVKAVMASKSVRFMPNYSSETHLSFGGGSAAGYAVFTWDLSFSEEKFNRGEVQFNDYPDDELFRSIKKILTDKYGTRRSETFKPSDLSAEWRLVAPMAPQCIAIHLWISGARKGRRLHLEYRSEALDKPSAASPAPKVKTDAL